VVNKSLRSKQERIGVSIQLVKGSEDDADLLKAIEKIPLGERQTTLKNWLRQSQGFKTVLLSDVSGVDHTEALKYLVDRMEWLESQMTSLHPYLEDKFANVSMRPAAFGSPPVDPPQTQGGISSETLAKRTDNFNKRKW